MEAHQQSGGLPIPSQSDYVQPVRRAIYKKAALELIAELNAFVNEANARQQTIQTDPTFVAHGYKDDLNWGGQFQDAYLNRFGNEPKALVHILANELGIATAEIHNAFDLTIGISETMSAKQGKLRQGIEELTRLAFQLDPILRSPSDQRGSEVTYAPA